MIEFPFDKYLERVSLHFSHMTESEKKITKIIWDENYAIWECVRAIVALRHKELNLAE